jgi:oxygen-independent coproporphyrinogen-3 oxidase
MLRSPERWLEAVERNGTGLESSTIVTNTERVEELLLSGLRLAEGVSLERVLRETGTNLTPFLVSPTVQEWARNGFMETDAARLRLTRKGRLLLDTLVGELVQLTA